MLAQQQIDSLTKAKQLADEAFKDYLGLQMSLHHDAQLYATIALAEAIVRLTVALQEGQGAKVVGDDYLCR